MTGQREENKETGNAGDGDALPTVTLVPMCDVKSIGNVERMGWLRWFGDVEKMEVDRWLRRVMNMQVEGRA